MCGISGIIYEKNHPASLQEIKAMTDIISYRGPNSDGFLLNDNVALGHRRLSIIDLSDTANQPLYYASNRYAIVFNGEIFNYIEIKEELQQQGLSFATRSDTEVILAAYHHWGVDCLHKFNGMWSFAIFDSLNKTVFCARDRFGIKPFYYTTIGKRFCFGSEIKQFSVFREWTSRLNFSVAWDYLSHGGFDYDSSTFFENVHQLKGGEYLVYNAKAGEYDIKEYYNVNNFKTKSADLNETEYIEGFKNIFYDAVNLRLRSDVKVGTALSGGLDSTSIIIAMNGILKESKTLDIQESISAVFDVPKYSETAFIDIAAKSANIRNHKKTLGFPDVMDSIDKVLWHMDEPFGSMSMIAGYHVFKLAREHGITVMLNGQGADETLAGYDKFFKPLIEGYLKRYQFIQAIQTLVAIKSLHGELSVGAYFNKSIKDFFFGKTPSWLHFPSDAVSKIRKFKRTQDANIDSTSHNLIKEIGLPMLLHYEDRNSMAHSVEARVPFLDYRLVEYCLALPDYMKINKGIRKYVLREAMKNKLPNDIYTRYDKKGFVSPQPYWTFQHADTFHHLLKKAPEMTYGIVGSEILSLLQSYQKGKFKDYSIFWRAIVFSKWMKMFKVKI
jgi:asparagine synthase (glutamine-hydrolysing)